MDAYIKGMMGMTYTTVTQGTTSAATGIKTVRIGDGAQWTMDTTGKWLQTK